LRGKVKVDKMLTSPAKAAPACRSAIAILIGYNGRSDPRIIAPLYLQSRATWNYENSTVMIESTPFLN
jgi:hypothetical protein